MRNIILIILEVLVCYISMLVIYKKYKTDGLYTYGIIATFMSCMMSLKQIEIMGIPVPVGFGVITSIIIAGNIITQNRGPEEIKTYIILILVTSLISFCFLNMTGLIKSSIYNEYANTAYDKIFEFNIRVYLALIISLITSIILSSKLYFLLKRLQNKIIISNIFSIIIIELLENLLFILIAYLFDLELVNLILCLVLRYMIKTVIGIIGTIPIYIANHIK